MTTAAVISLLVAATALVLSATSVWLSVLRPATLGLTYLPEHTRFDRGGSNGLPAITEFQISIALANVGAKAGLLLRVDPMSFQINGEQAGRFAGGIVPGMHGAETLPLVVLDGEPFTSPRAIERGDVRALQLNIGLAGVFQEELLKEGEGAAPERVALARRLRDLESVAFTVVCKYRRGAGLFLRKEATCPIRISGEGLRQAAERYWDPLHEEELLEIVREGLGREPSPNYDI